MKKLGRRFKSFNTSTSISLSNKSKGCTKSSSELLCTSSKLGSTRPIQRCTLKMCTWSVKCRTMSTRRLSDHSRQGYMNLPNLLSKLLRHTVQSAIKVRVLRKEEGRSVQLEVLSTQMQAMTNSCKWLMKAMGGLAKTSKRSTTNKRATETSLLSKRPTLESLESFIKSSLKWWSEILKRAGQLACTKSTFWTCWSIFTSSAIEESATTPFRHHSCQKSSPVC